MIDIELRFHNVKNGNENYVKFCVDENVVGLYYPYLLSSSSVSPKGNRSRKIPFGGSRLFDTLRFSSRGLEPDVPKFEAVMS